MDPRLSRPRHHILRRLSAAGTATDLPYLYTVPLYWDLLSHVFEWPGFSLLLVKLLTGPTILNKVLHGPLNIPTFMATCTYLKNRPSIHKGGAKQSSRPITHLDSP